MARVLFLCLHNAGRSQMSAALFQRAAKGRHEALSAGSEADREGHVHAEVVTVMRELGVDLSDRRPQRLTRELAEQADVVVTMGCGDACPHIPGKRYLDCDYACARSSSAEGTTIGPSGGWVKRSGFPKGSRSAQSVP